MAESTPAAWRTAGGPGLEREVAPGAEESCATAEPTLLARLLATQAAFDSRTAQKAEKERCEMEHLRIGQEELRVIVKQLLADKAHLNEHRADFEELRGSIEELRTGFKEIRSDKTDSHDLHTDFAQLRADVKDLWANFKRFRDDKADANDVRTDFAGIRADIKEIRADLKELKVGKGETDDLRRDFVQLRADAKELHAGFKELRADVGDINQLGADFGKFRDDTKELDAKYKDLRSDVNNLYTDCKELQADTSELNADLTTLIHCFERENPTVAQHLLRERAARAGASLDRILTLPHLAHPILAYADLRTWSAARRASKSTLQSCSSEGVQEQKVFVACGTSMHMGADDDVLRTAECFSFQDDQWQPLPANYKRCDHAGAVLAGCFYLFGGAGDLGHTAIRYNPARDPARRRWESITSMSCSRRHAAVAVTHRHLYVCGGEHLLQVFNSVARFDPSQGIKSQHAWEMQPAMTIGRHHFAAVAFQEGILACGGYDRPTGQEHLLSVDVARSSEMLSFGTQAWSPLAPMTSPRRSHSATVVGGTVVVCGGERVGTGEVLQSVELFDPSSQAWAESATMFLMQPRVHHAAVAVAGGLLVLGGFRQSFHGTPAESTVMYLDCAARACIELQPMGSSRAGFAAGVISIGPTAAP